MVDVKLNVHVPPLGAMLVQLLVSCVTPIQPPGNCALTLYVAALVPVLVTVKVPLVLLTGMMPVVLTLKVVSTLGI